LIPREWSVELHYGIHQHQHRFAAWAAARAASTTNRRFAVSVGESWLVAVGLHAGLQIEQLPETAEAFDVWHRNLRGALIRASDGALSHGQAAKLLNCYLKARFITSFSTGLPAASVAHPPIDRLLLSKILEAGILEFDRARAIRKLREAAWSNWNSDEYEEAIHILRSINPDEPFWMIEQYWPGYK